MNPQRWRVVTEIFHAALERPSDERPLYLVEACRQEPSLRADVEALLAGDDRAGVLGDPLATAHAALSPATVLGPYCVEALLDSGGMGEVYKARDTRLKRDVAIKVLPAGVSADPDRLVRFEREARAAATLNHPNICAVFDIGTHDGAPFIVSELLEGETLRQICLDGPLAVRRALGYAVPIARGLAAAHVKGIVHRDLKPENVFITTEARVKILDFGVAKVTNTIAGETDRGTPRTLTEVGAVVGTISYMSPEQVRGMPADSRSDIFSFGTVLFEMLAGRRPFRGDTSADTSSAILREDPPALMPEGGVPPELERIVRRCLEKAPRNRFQSADDLAFALEAICGVSPTSVSTAPATRRPPRLLRMTIAGAVLATTGLIIGARLQKNALPTQPTFTPLTFRRGAVHNARFAPDGQTIVYGAAWDGKPYDIFTTRRDLVESRSLGLPSATVLAISSAGEMAILLGCNLNFRFVFAPCEGTLARVPLVGGSPRPLVEHAGQADWSPDGKRLVVTVHDPSGGYRLESPIGTVLYRTSDDADGIYYPRFSPAGDRIAFWERGTVTGRPGIVDLAGHKTVLAGEFRLILGLSWSPTGDEIWFSSIRQDGGSIGGAVYGITPSGRQRVVWRADGQLQLHDVSRDGRVLMSRLRGTKAMAGVVSGETTERDLSWFQWSGVGDLSPDGATVLFEDLAYGIEGRYSAYLRSVDGSPPIRLAEGRVNTLSRDGKWAIVGSRELRIVPTGPGESRALPKGSFDSFGWASWLEGQARIVFSAKERGHGWRCYVQDVAGGLPRPITPEGVEATKWNLLVSPDRRHIVAQDWAGKVAMYPIEGGPPRAIPGSVVGDDAIQWSVDGHVLYVRAAADSPAMVYRVDLTTGHRDLWKAISPQDPAGVRGVGKVSMTQDASTYVYSYWRSLNELFLAEGIK